MTTTHQIITMTDAETEIYDGGGEAADGLMRMLRAGVAELGGTVEIHTADGIVADVVQD